MAAGYQLAPAKNVSDLLGYSNPGALLLPVSVRAPHTVYQTVGLIAYVKQLVVSNYSRLETPCPTAADTGVGPLDLDVQVSSPTEIAGPLRNDDICSPSSIDPQALLNSRLEVDSATLSSSWHAIAVDSPSEPPSVGQPLTSLLQHKCTVQIGVPNTLLALPHVQRALCIFSGQASCLGLATSPKLFFCFAHPLIVAVAQSDHIGLMGM